MAEKTGCDQAFTTESLYGMGGEPTFAGALSFMRRRYTRNLAGVDVAVSGIALDLATTNPPGARFGPAGIRRAVGGESRATCTPSDGTSPTGGRGHARDGREAARAGRLRAPAAHAVAGSGAADIAGHAAPRRDRQAGAVVVHAGDDGEVGEVPPRGPDADAHRAGAEYGSIQLADRHTIESVERRAPQRAHRGHASPPGLVRGGTLPHAVG